MSPSGFYQTIPFNLNERLHNHSTHLIEKPFARITKETKGRVNCLNLGLVPGSWQLAGGLSEGGGRALGRAAGETKMRSWPGRHPHPTASQDRPFYAPWVPATLGTLLFLVLQIKN